MSTNYYEREYKPRAKLADKKFYKVMKKTICITSKDSAVKTYAASLEILSEFKNRGFSSRAAFVNIVAEMNDKYKDYRKVRQLEFFWIMRAHNNELNNDLSEILEQLKAE